jgi:hypothetical protein
MKILFFSRKINTYEAWITCIGMATDSQGRFHFLPVAGNNVLFHFPADQFHEIICLSD